MLKVLITNNKGFTLAEILVTIGVAAILLILLTEVFFSSIRGGNKSQILSVLNQNGRSLLDIIGKDVMNADSIICPDFRDDDDTVSDNVLVLFKNGEYTRYRFLDKLTPEVDSMIRDTPTPVGDEQQNLNIYARTVCSTSEINALNPLNLTDTNAKTGISILLPNTGFIFTRSKNSGSGKDSLSVNFRLEPASQAGLKLPGLIDPVLFSTTVEVR